MLRLEGVLEGRLELSITEKFGYCVHRIEMSSANQATQFSANYDLTKFEIVARSVGVPIKVSLSKIRLTRIG